MGGLRRVDKACKKCGAMMYQVPSKDCTAINVETPYRVTCQRRKKSLKSSHCQKSCAKQIRRACNMRPTAKSTDFTKKKSSGRCSESTGKSSLLIPSEGRVKMRKRRQSRFWPTRITARKVTFM